MKHAKYYLAVFDLIVEYTSEEGLVEFFGESRDWLHLHEEEKIQKVKELPDDVVRRGLVAPLITDDYIERELYWRFAQFKEFGLVKADLDHMMSIDKLPDDISKTNRLKWAAMEAWVNRQPRPDYVPIRDADVEKDFILNYTPEEHHALVEQVYGDIKRVSDDTFPNKTEVQ